MPCCSVVVCGNSSCKVNYMEHGISFHTFPKDPKLKEMWIKATGRGPNWFPTKNSSICSSHFERKCFQPLKKVRRLFEWSLPTLNLRMVLTNCMEPSTSKVSVDSEEDLYCKKKPILALYTSSTKSDDDGNENNDDAVSTNARRKDLRGQNSPGPQRV